MKSFPSKTQPLPNLPVAAVDFETYYDDVYSVSSMSYWAYTHHELFDPYLVSISTSDGIRYVGDPREFDWAKIANHIWVSHNRPFDSSVFDAAVEQGMWKASRPVYWGNSANLAAWMKVSRNLKGAVFQLYGASIDKTVRDKDMKGVQWKDMPQKLKDKIIAYAGDDADWSLKIWVDFVHTWPDHERRIGDLIDERGLRGFYSDRAGIEADCLILERVMYEAKQKLPWKDKVDEVLSPTELAIACREAGITPPSSLAKTSEECKEWEEKYGDKYPWVGAMRDWRRANTAREKYLEWLRRIKPDGRAQFSIMYLGTATGRTASGDKASEKKRSGFNVLNFYKDPLFVTKDWRLITTKEDLKRVIDFEKEHKCLPSDIAHAVNMRSRIVAPPGKKLQICDKSQIEARITRWVSGDRKMLDVVRTGVSVYEAHAISTMGYTRQEKPLKKANPSMYALSKARELALGFNAGHVKFIVMAPLYVTDEEFLQIFDGETTPERNEAYLRWLQATRQVGLLAQWKTLDEQQRRWRVNSWEQVQNFRQTNPLITGAWKKFDIALRNSLGSDYEVTLPSGRSLAYFNVHMNDGEIQAMPVRGEEYRSYFGGKILENIVQATARDTFVCDQLLADDAGIEIILDVYDELVAEVDDSDDGSSLISIMSHSPSWAKSLPIGCESEFSTFYKK